MNQKAYFNWSSGKDSAFALYKYLKSGGEIHELVTTINQKRQRVTMHGLSVDLLERQLNQIQIPYSFIELPEQASMEDYERIMTDKVTELKSRGFSTAVFGDIFLEDLKKYREANLSKMGVDCQFPLWKQNTTQLIRDFIHSGFKTVVICVNGNLLDQSFVGRVIDEQFMDDLPEGIDPCGENGEFHTFCFDGPIFKQAVDYQIDRIETHYYPNPEKEGGKVGYYFGELI